MAIKTIYEKIEHQNYDDCDQCGNSPCVRTARRYWNPRITFIKNRGMRTWMDGLGRTWTAGKLKWKGTNKGSKRICQECYDAAIGRISQANLDIWHKGYIGE